MSLERGNGPSRREWLLAALGLAAGCGGGVDSGGTGIGDAPTLAVGSITGFGSIIVNGVRFDDRVASVSDDDRSRTRDDLRLGMRTEVVGSAVSVVGGVSLATASSIRIRSEIEGPIESIDLAAGQLMVLGQSVLVVATTVIDPGDHAVPLAVGDLLEVHASLDVARTRYVASRIERRAALERHKLRGVVAELDLAGRTLRIGALRIDWSGAAPPDPAAALAPGRLLRITLATTPAVGTRHALSIASDAPSLVDRDRVEFEGRISSFTSITDFAVDGVPVDGRGAAFEGGAAGLVLGARVEVEGSLRNGVLLASAVELEDDEGTDQSFEVSGAIESADAAAKSFVVRGVFVVWSASTRFEGGSPVDLVAGRPIEVRGRLSADGQRIDATLIHVGA